jgi:hypothetical protein
MTARSSQATQRPRATTHPSSQRRRPTGSTEFNHQSLTYNQKLEKVQWKKVADYIHKFGSSYQFGNATCKWRRDPGERQATSLSNFCKE